ncbi:MAG: type II toxin-antitoxin system VapC family toxin [Rhodospirillaceae bacterium]|nr:type II toxin-antitoxin system VapC family toxin [Rhodospirillaceae bacterium]
MIVLDASAALEVLLRAPEAPAVERRIFAAGETLHAPHLIDLEVAQVLRRYVLTRQVAPERCREALEDFADFPLSRYPHDFMLPRIWELRTNLTAYDGAYVALAEALDAPLLTRDERLAGAVGHRARVELV